MRPFACLFAIVVLAACTPEPQPARPALWEVRTADGRQGWLFGTVHASPRPLAWRSPVIDGALGKAGTVVVEVGNLADERAVSATFARLARSSAPLPPLSQRIETARRAALAALLDKAGARDTDFAATDTWAAALTLANAGESPDDARNGVDRAVIDAAAGRQLIELEGAEAQLVIFDSLPEREQRDLLAEVAAEAAQPDPDISASWRSGDMRAIERETRTGLLADPELREVLYAGRNRRWTSRIADLVRQGRRPFVAVGAAHMAGPDGLPAMLERQGFTVTRVQ